MWNTLWVRHSLFSKLIKRYTRRFYAPSYTVPTPVARIVLTIQAPKVSAVSRTRSTVVKLAFFRPYPPDLAKHSSMSPRSSELCFLGDSTAYTLSAKEPLIKSSADCVAGKMRMDARRATKVVAWTTKPRSATTQTPHFAATRRDEACPGGMLCRSACEGGLAIHCASLRASHPGKPPSQPRGT